MIRYAAEFIFSNCPWDSNLAQAGATSSSEEKNKNNAKLKIVQKGVLI